MRLRKPRGKWKAITYSFGIGWAVGTLFGVGYLVSSLVFCSRLLVCPTSWVPYAIIFLSISFGLALIGLTVGLAYNCLQRCFYSDVV